MYRCAYSSATWVLPTPPRPCKAIGATTAMLVPVRRSCNCSSTSTRPVNTAFRVGTCQMGGLLRGDRARREHLVDGRPLVPPGHVDRQPVERRSRVNVGDLDRDEPPAGADRV